MRERVRMCMYRSNRVKRNRITFFVCGREIMLNQAQELFFLVSALCIEVCSEQSRKISQSLWAFCGTRTDSFIIFTCSSDLWITKPTDSMQTH